MYAPGTFGSQLNGKRVRIFEAYVERRQMLNAGLLSAEEAMSTSDFATYFGSFQRHTFTQRFNEVTGKWASYSRPMPLEDWEEHTASGFGRFPDIPQKPLNGPYEEMAIIETPGPTVRLYEFGAGWSLTRQLIITDALNKLRDLPNLAAEAFARTISKRAAVTTLQSNPTMYDGNALFSSAHGNIGSTALTADITGMNAYIAADQDLIDQTDYEGYPIEASSDRRVLIIPKAYRWVVAALFQNQLLNNGSNVLLPNMVQGKVDEIIEEPYFTDANNWYIATDPTGPGAFMAALTLNGENTPFIGLEDPGVRAITGGDDPYSFDFDEVRYKTRHDFDFKAIEWRTVYGGVVA